MPYDKLLAIRIHAVLGPLPGLEEKKMFGGVGFLVNGNFACGIHKNDLIVRVGPQKHAWALYPPFRYDRPPDAPLDRGRSARLRHRDRTARTASIPPFLFVQWGELVPRSSRDARRAGGPNLALTALI